jgi:hypothetical protein
MGQSEDWIELFNRGTAAMDLTGWYLTDNPWNVSKWPIPAGTVVEPGAYLMVWADEDGSDGPLHANFKLSASGELLWLIDDAGLIRDAVEFPALDADMAYARVPNGTGSFIVQGPTFAANNETVGVSDLASPCDFDLRPNPVRAGSALEWTGRSLEIWNTEGKLVARTANKALTAPAAPGNYVLRGTSNCGTTTDHLIVTP